MQSAIVQKVQSFTAINLMLELEKINDGIPENTPFDLDRNRLICLKCIINDSVIRFARDRKSIPAIVRLKHLFETLTDQKIEVKEVNCNPQAEQLERLALIVNTSPDGKPITIREENYPCMRLASSMVLEGYTNARKNELDIWIDYTAIIIESTKINNIS